MSGTANLETPAGAAQRLAPVLPARWALARRHAALCAAFCGLFLYLDYLPAVHPGTWLHALAGRSILASRSLPDVDLAQPFSEGMRVIHTSWLSDATTGLIEKWCGRESVSHLVAVAGALLFAMLAWLYYVQVHRWWPSLAGLAMVLALGGNPGRLPLAEVFGLLCLTAMLAVVPRLAREESPQRGDDGAAGPNPAWGWQTWGLIGAIQLVWTNLHSSFLIGVAVLACYAVSRTLQAAWQTRSPMAVLADRSVQRWVLLTEWAALAALANPYGVHLAAEACANLANIQVRAGSDWAPLRLASFSGLAFLGSLGLLAVVLRRSARPVRFVEALQLSLGVVAVAMTSRALVWYAVIYVFTVLPHLADAVRRQGAQDESPAGRPTVAAATNSRFGWTLACVAMVWLTFCFAPVSSGLLGRDARTGRIAGSLLPVAVAEHLRQQAEPQVVFAPLEWADWLAWDQAPKVAAMMTSNVQWAPQRVWADYQRVLRAEAGWDKVLQRYHVDWIVLQTAGQPELARQVRLSPQWRVAVDADGALLAVRSRERAHRREESDDCGESAHESGARQQDLGETSGLAGLPLQRRRPWIKTS